MNVLQEFWRNVLPLRIPFTFGQATSRLTLVRHLPTEGHDPNKPNVVYRATTIDSGDEEPEIRAESPSVFYNGLISSMQMFLVLIVISSSSTCSVLLRNDFNSLASPVTLMTYMSLGIVVMVLFMSARRRLLIVPVSSEDAPVVIERDSLSIVGIVIFYVLVCVLDIFRIAASLTCRDVFVNCKDGVYSLFIVQILFPAIRIAYLGLKTAFCFTFRCATFLDRVLTRYGLLYLQAVNLSLWFDALIQESTEVFRPNLETKGFYNSCLDNNGSRVTEEILECLYHNNTVYNMTETLVTPICLPFVIEFTLLVGELLGYTFYNCNRLESSGSGTGGECPMDCLIEDYVPFRDIPPQADETTSLLEMAPTNARTTQPWVNMGYQLWVIFVIISSVVLCVLTVISRFRPETFVADYKRFALSYLLTCWIFMAIVTLLGYHVSRTLTIGRWKSFSSMDYLLLFTSVGPLFYNSFTCIAICGQEENPTFDPRFLLALELSNAVHIYIQTNFCLFADRIETRGQERTWNATIFRAIILQQAVTNGALWLSGTFGGYEYGGFEVKTGVSLQAAYFGQGAWAIIYNIAVPMLLFYRFNSCLVFVRIYLRISKP